MLIPLYCSDYNPTYITVKILGRYLAYGLRTFWTTLHSCAVLLLLTFVCFSTLHIYFRNSEFRTPLKLWYQSNNSTLLGTFRKTFLALKYVWCFIPSRLKVTVCFAFLYMLNTERFKTCSSGRGFLGRVCVCKITLLKKLWWKPLKRW